MNAEDQANQDAFCKWAATQGITDVCFADVTAINRTIGKVSGTLNHHLTLLDREWEIWCASRRDADARYQKLLDHLADKYLKLRAGNYGGLSKMQVQEQKNLLTQLYSRITDGERISKRADELDKIEPLEIDPSLSTEDK